MKLKDTSLALLGHEEDSECSINLAAASQQFAVSRKEVASWLLAYKLQQCSKFENKTTTKQQGTGLVVEALRLGIRIDIGIGYCT